MLLGHAPRFADLFDECVSYFVTLGTTAYASVEHVQIAVPADILEHSIGDRYFPMLSV